MKTRIYCFLILTVVLLFNACTTQIKHNTPSGRPEITINGQVGKRIQAEIMNLVLNNGYDLKSSTNTLMIFERPVKDMFFRMLLASNYDSKPATRITIIIIETANSTRIIASFVAVTNPGSAFERILSLNNNPDTAEFQIQLNKIKETIAE